MNIHILVQPDTEATVILNMPIGSIENTVKIYNIDNLIQKLKSFGFSPSIFTEFPKNNKDDYFLLFQSQDILLPSEARKRIVLMNSVLSNINSAIRKYKFPIIVETNKYFRDVPIIVGEESIAKAAGLTFIDPLIEGYGFIRHESGKGIIELIIEYLKKYDELEKTK